MSIFGKSTNTSEANPYRMWKLEDSSELMRAQSMKITKGGHAVMQTKVSSIMTKTRLERMRRDKKTPPEIAIIIKPPFSNFDRINDNLYITSIGGLITDNIQAKKITFILNCTFELALLNVKEIDSLRVPIDDDPDENILIYVDDVCEIIKQVSEKNGRTLVHCMAGASRSSTFVIAYLIKYQNMSLRNAFCYVNATRECCRPNMGFMKQLMMFEQHLRNECSVTMLTIRDQSSQAVAIVPEFYRTLFPELYNIEVIKQIRHAGLTPGGIQTTKSVTPSKLTEGTKNYMNRERGFNKIAEDIEKFKISSTEKSGYANEKDPKSRSPKSKDDNPKSRTPK